jgi:hypothetical protein
MEFEKYIYNKPKPQAPSKPVLKGKTPQDHRDYADALEIYERKMIDNKAELSTWYDERAALFEQFQYDLFIEAGIAHLPKRKAIFDFAWKHCYENDNPYEDTYTFVIELVELFP